MTFLIVWSTKEISLVFWYFHHNSPEYHPQNPNTVAPLKYQPHRTRHNVDIKEVSTKSHINVDIREVIVL